MGVPSKTANPTYKAIISMKNILALVILVILAIYGYADAQGPPPPPRRPGRSGRPTRPPPFDGQIDGGFGGVAQRLLYGSYRKLTVTNAVTEDWGECFVVFEGVIDRDPPDCGPTGETIDRKAEKKCKLLGAGASEKYYTRAKCFFTKTNKDEELW